jgi:alpha-glucosidase
MTRIVPFLWILIALPVCAQDVSTFSPDGRIEVVFELNDVRAPEYMVRIDGRTMLERSPLGLVTSLAWWDRDLTLAEVGDIQRIEEHYELHHGKRSVATYSANRRVVRLTDPEGHALDVVFQVSDDGVAFRYRVPEHAEATRITTSRETTGFRFSPETRTWLMPLDHPQTGWMNTNPSYEQYYTPGVRVGGVAPARVGWAFPGLFHTESVGWALVSEAGLDANYVGSRLRADADRGLYRIDFPDAGEGHGPSDPVEPTSDLPFESPWRVIILGESLAPIVESTLVTDVSPPSVIDGADWIQPGRASWSWLPLKDDSMEMEVQREFVDMAALYGFEYTLVDALWDERLGYDGLRELARYAAGRGVGLLVWYNSNGEFNQAPQTPRDRIHEPDVRRREFALLHEMGIRGIKVDFMGGDKQSVIGLYIDILRDAAEHQLMVNFHGATLPRGWQRTFPNYVTAEAVLGYEYPTFDQVHADAVANHGTVLPFTRNVVGPMDYTPTMMTDRIGPSVRRTSDGYDLAMAVVFESGIQHFGLTPAVMAGLPAYVTDFLREVPAAWDETRLVEGYPGDYVVLARRTGSRWYVAGLNGLDEERHVQLELPFVTDSWQGNVISDDDGTAGVRHETVSSGDGIHLPGRGGFVLVIDDSPAP